MEIKTIEWRKIFGQLLVRWNSLDNSELEFAPDFEVIAG